MAWLPKNLIVVPYDFSEEARDAIETALQLTDNPSKVRVVYSMQDLSPLEMGEMYSTINDQTRREHSLQAMREKLADMKFANVLLDVVFGDPGYTVSTYASDHQADLIVLPSHGRTGLPRMLIGSVAERIVRHAHCPVLVLRK